MCVCVCVFVVVIDIFVVIINALFLFLERQNTREKNKMRDTLSLAVPGPSAPQTAAEPLSAPRTLLQQPQQPDQPLQHRLPADASGLAATIRGPLAPELYDLVVKQQSAATAAAPRTSARSQPRPPLQPLPLRPSPLLEPCPAPLSGGTGSWRRRSVVPGS